MTAAAATDLGLARLVKLEERISGAEGTGLRARWEFGRELLAARDGKGRLPNGYLTAVAKQTGASRSELKYRAQFAERFASGEQLATAVASYGSWTEIREQVLGKPKPMPVSAPLVAPEGQFATIVADPPWRYDNKSTRGAAEDH